MLLARILWHPDYHRPCSGSNTSPPDSRQILISPCPLICHHNHPFSIFHLCRLSSPPLPVALGPFYRLYHVLRIADPHRLQTLRQTHGHVITADVQIVYLPWGNERDLRSLDVTNCCNYERTTGQGVSP